MYKPTFKYPINSEPPNSTYAPAFKLPYNYRKCSFLNETVGLFRPTTFELLVSECVHGAHTVWLLPLMS